MLVRGIDEDLGAAFGVTLGGLADQHQGLGGIAVAEDGLGVPGDIQRGMPQEVGVTQLRPQLLGVIGIDAATHQGVEGRLLGAADLLFAIGPDSPGHDAGHAWSRCTAAAAGWRARNSTATDWSR